MGHDSSKGSAFLRPKGMPSFSPSVILSPVEIGSPNGRSWCVSSSIQTEGLAGPQESVKTPLGEGHPKCLFGMPTHGLYIYIYTRATSLATCPVCANLLPARNDFPFHPLTVYSIAPVGAITLIVVTEGTSRMNSSKKPALASRRLVLCRWFRANVFGAPHIPIPGAKGTAGNLLHTLQE